MRKNFSIPSDNYTSTPYVEEFSMQAGRYSIKRVVLVIDGNTAACEFGVYIAASGKTTLTDAERAIGEVYVNDSVAAATLPAPELNYVGDPIACDLKSGESLYIRFLAGDNPASADGRLYL